MNTMGERICQKRMEAGMTMEELGEYLGVQKSAINKWEKGEVINIKRPYIEQMANLFHVSPSWLMGYDESTKEPPRYGGARGTAKFYSRPSTYIPSSDEMVSYEEVLKALQLYSQYKNAIPPIQDAVENLLKSSQPDPQAESQSDS